MCKVAPFAATLSVNVSIFTLVAISLDRYYVILYPFRPKMSLTHCYSIIFIIWIAAITISSVNLFNYLVTPDQQCLPNYLALFEWHSVFLVFIQYLVPFLIITFTYFRIGYHIYFDDSPNSVTKNQGKNKKKVLSAQWKYKFFELEFIRSLKKIFFS
jgi:hypothetical protein